MLRILRPPVSAAALALLSTQAAFADSTAAPAATAVTTATSQAQGQPDALPPQWLIITATRQNQPALDYPGSISRVDVADIQRLGAVHHSDLLNRAPGAFIQRGSGRESLTAIRSPVLTGAGSCGAFLFLEDSVPIRPTGFCNVNALFEVNTLQAQGIEIVRGPGSALYGSSALHGIVNVLMPEPKQLPTVAAAVDVGSADFLRGRLAMGRPGTDTDLGLEANWTDEGGFRDHTGLEEQKLNAMLVHRAARGRLQLGLAATRLDQDTGGFIEGFESYRDAQARRSNANPEAFRAANSARLTAQWQAPLNAQTAFDLRATVRHSRMQFLQHFLLGKPLERNGQNSAALLLSVDRELKWGAHLTSGIDAEVAHSFLLEFQADPTLSGAPAANAIRPAGRHYDYTVDAGMLAAYTQLALPLTSSLTLNAGVRAEQVRYDYDNRMLAGNTAEDGVGCAFGGCLYHRPADRRDDFTNLAPKFGLTWALAASQRLYVNVALGYRAPEITELYRLQRQQSSVELDSENLLSSELGWRAESARGRYSVAAFHMDKRHVIFRNSSGFNVSDGHTRHEGIEYEFVWRAHRSLDLSAAGTFARHRYAFDRDVEGGERIRSGNDIDTAPRRLHALRAAWQPLAQVHAELEWLYVGEYFLEAANAHRYNGHDLLNMRLGWQASMRWHFAARLDNVLNRPYADRGDFAFGTYRYFPGRDRSAFIEIGYATE